MEVIDHQAFWWCDKLSDINIPNSVLTIGQYALHDTVWYNNQPNGMLYAGNVAYGYKGDLSQETSLEIKSGIKSIASYAFEDFKGLKSIILSADIIDIGIQAFIGCTGLTSITIPDSVCAIRSYAFEDCSSLTNIYYKGSEDEWEAITKGTDWDVDTGDYTIYYNYVEECANHTSSDWITDTEATCTKVGTKHKECTVCGKILETEEIRKLAHSYTTSVVTAPTCTAQGYTTHSCSCGDSYVDTYVDALGHDIVSHEAKAPTCTAVGWYAYEACSRCNYTTRTDIPKIAHNYVDGVCTECCTDSNTTDGLLYSYNSDTQSYIISGYTGSDSEIRIPSVYNDGTNGKHAITGIGDSAFSGCFDLITSVAIPDSVTSIGNAAFGACYNITSIVISDNVTTIGDGAFCNCMGLSDITIGSGVTSIGNNAFYFTSINNINYNGTKAQWNAIAKGDNWEGQFMSSITCTDGIITL